MYRLEILISYYTNWRLYVIKISRDYLHLFFRKKLFLKNFAFSLSHDNKSKNYPIVLKFGTDVAFIYLQIEFVAQKNPNNIYLFIAFFLLQFYNQNATTVFL